MRSGLRGVALAVTIGLAGFATSEAQKLNDLEMAHVAVTANNVDIAYAHLALAFSSDADIRNFAETMIRDHSAVNQQVAKLAKELGVTAQDNAVSRQMKANAAKVMDELSQLRGEEFDRRYAANEAAYHKAVNTTVANDFIPNIQNERVKQAFEGALKIFLVHQDHAEKLDQARM